MVKMDKPYAAGLFSSFQSFVIHDLLTLNETLECKLSRAMAELRPNA